MRLAFDEVKATQAAATLLRLAGGSLNYLLLIKLLYKVDREALRRWGLPVTTDKYVSMPLGPVTSQIYDLIKSGCKQNQHPTFWAAYIRRDQNPQKVCLAADPGVSELSPAEEKLLAEVFAQDGATPPFDVVAQIHRDFAEWKDPGSSSIPLEIPEIIRALGLSEEEAAHIADLVDRQRASAQLAI
jgi:hypothetical protein